MRGLGVLAGVAEQDGSPAALVIGGAEPVAATEAGDLLDRGQHLLDDGPVDRHGG